MGYSNGIVTAPVSVSDVQSAIGSSSSDLATLCTNSNINKWARYKPIRYAKISAITESERRSVNHGIVIPDVTRISSLTVSAIQDAAANDWGYNKPNGGSSAPYRLTDFALTNSVGYYRDAVPPIQIVYPRGGWTFMRGSSQRRTMTIYFDLDPDDSTVNLQADDFITSNINLNEWKFIAALSGYVSGTWDSDTILSDNLINGNFIEIDIPNGTGSYNVRVAVCMYRYNSGKYELIPVPKYGNVDNSNLTLKIIDDAQASGGGIGGNTSEEMFNNVSFGYSLDGTYKTAWECTDNGIAKYCMKGDGSIYVKMNLTNKSGATSTILMSDFKLDLDGKANRVPNTMYNASKSSVSSISIPNNDTVTCYLYFDNIFSAIGADWSTSNKNSSFSMDFSRSGATLIGGDIYCMLYTNASPATRGWVER